MSSRNKAVALIIVGLILSWIAKIPAIRDTWVNAVLTGASLLVLVYGLFRLWKTRSTA